MTDKAKNGTQIGKRKNNGGNLNGRPKGVKNKATLVKEAIRGNFDDLLVAKGKKMLEVIMDEVIENRNMQAAKLIMDRALPTSKAIDLEQLEKSKGLTISINVGALEKVVAEQDAVVIEDGEIVDV